jgi:hypothetical protein
MGAQNIQEKKQGTFYSIEDLSDITNEDLDRLVGFLPFIKNDSHRWTEEGYLSDTRLQAFYQELLRKWVRPCNWPEWKTQGMAYYKNPDLLKKAELHEVVKLITLHVRQDRFAEGHLLSVIKMAT